MTLDLICTRAVAYFGQAAQLKKAAEELSELQVEVARLGTARQDLEALVDEIADVEIMLEQLRIMFGVRRQVAERMDYKLARLARKMDEEGEKKC